MIESPTGAPAAADPAPRPARGRSFGLFTVGLAVVAAAVLGLATFSALASVDLSSVHPFGSTVGWLTLFAVAAGASLLGLLLALIALVRCRPRTVAVVALAAALGLPVLAVWVATGLGVDTLRNNVTADLVTDAGIVRRGLDVLDAWQVDVEPIRALLPPEAGS